MNNILYNVFSPKLGIYLKISPIAFKIGHFYVHWYGIIIALGFLLGFLYISRRAHEFGLNQNDVTDFALIASICGILGARIYYVIFYPSNFYNS